MKLIGLRVSRVPCLALARRLRHQAPLCAHADANDNCNRCASLASSPLSRSLSPSWLPFEGPEKGQNPKGCQVVAAVLQRPLWLPILERRRQRRLLPGRKQHENRRKKVSLLSAVPAGCTRGAAPLPGGLKNIYMKRGQNKMNRRCACAPLSCEPGAWRQRVRSVRSFSLSLASLLCANNSGAGSEGRGRKNRKLLWAWLSRVGGCCCPCGAHGNHRV